jgi:hypothetical protein
VSTPESRERLAAERDWITMQIAELMSARDRLNDIIDLTLRPNPTCDYV